MTSGSRMAIALACPASEALPQVNNTSEAADQGVAIHAYLANVARLGARAALDAVPDEWRQVCETVDVDAVPDDCEPEVPLAYEPIHDKGRKLAEFGNRRYDDLEPGEIPCTPDGIVYAMGHVTVYDYKTGHAPVARPEDNGQLLFCALAASRAYEASTATVVLVRCPPGMSARSERFDLDWMALQGVRRRVIKMRAEVEAARAKLDAGVAPNVTEGPHCKYCRAYEACPAKRALLSTALELARTGDDPPMARAVWMWTELRGLVAQLGKRIHAAAARMPIDLGDGRVWGPVTTDGAARIVKPGVMHDIVAEVLGDEAASEAIAYHPHTSKALIKGVVGEHVPRGQKGATVRRIMEEGERRGAIERKPVTKFEAYPARRNP